MLKIMCSFLLAFVLLVGATHAELSVHFLDIGQGDAALVMCNDESMLIDGGPVAASQYLFSYIRQYVDELDVIIASHPHDDHVGGLAAALNAVPVGVIYSPVKEWDGIDWRNVTKYAEAQGTPIIVPVEGETFQLGSAEVTILHCWPEAWAENDMSIVLRINYGKTSFLFTGDAEEMSENMMLNDKVPLRADVLKVSHHGSRRASTKGFIKAVRPTWAVISCGKDNAYGHPNEEVLKTLIGSTKLRTDQLGTIIFRSDGTNLTVTTSIMPEVKATLVGNRKTMKFHRPKCEMVGNMAAANKVPLANRNDAIDMGFVPCGRCKP